MNHILMRSHIIILITAFLLVQCSSSTGSNGGDNGGGGGGNETPTYSLTASASPAEGGSVSPSSGTYDEGTEVDVEATTNEGWNFTGWSGDVSSSDNPVTVTMNSDKNITANFEKKSYELTVNTQGEGSVTEEVVQAKTYDHGTQVELTANPDEGWQFAEWQGDVTGTDNSAQITVDSPKEVTAVFEKKSYTLGTSVSGEGSIARSPDSQQYDYGTDVELTANAASGWAFTGWSGDVSSSDNPLTVTMNTDKDITANFREKAKAFSNIITVSDGNSSRDLTFGMDGNATDSFDKNLDEESPPEPPSGSFYSRFNIPNYHLFKDFRPVTRDSTSWELEFAPEEGRTIELSWDFSNTQQVGSLTLVDNLDNPSVQIDMKKNTSYSVSESVSKLYILSK